MPKAHQSFEIAHILFVDVVEYSKMLNNEQSEILRKLNDIVLRTKQVRASAAADQLICLPTGDGMALVFRDLPEAPAKCALEIAAALKSHPKIGVRMGVHTGPADEILDVNKRPNFSGEGLNTAQRIMDCGDAGHILLSKRVADDLARYGYWKPQLHDLGEVTAKHGLKISISNLYTGDLGNPAMPRKLRRAKRRRRAGIAAVALLGTLALSAALWLYLGGGKSIPWKSIAILPLDNLSDDPKDAFFAVGLQDDVVTRLANIKDVKVVPRRWVAQYDPKIPPNLPQIRKFFGVAHVLVGSVRHAGDRVVVNVQLIDTATGQHTWAQPYDRTLADSIGVQGELASAIAGQLRAFLTPDERARVEKEWTKNSDAWVFYMRGRQIQLRPETSHDNYLDAENLYRQAVELDPSFVLARAQLSFMQAQIYQFFEPTNAARLAEARKNADEALRLDANSAEAHLARARCAQLVGDNALTRSDLSTAVQLRPDDGDILLAAAVTQQQLGWEEEAAANYNRAAELGPREAKLFLNRGYLLYQTGHEAEARWALDRALILEPDSVYFRLVRAVAEVSWTGETRRARAILTQLPPGKDPDGRVTSAYCTLAILERKFPEALRLLRAYPKDTLSTVESGGMGEQQRKVEAEAAIRFYAGDYARACEYFESIRPDYEVAVRNNDLSASDHAALAILYAWMTHCKVDKRSNETGWKERAKAEASRVMELNASEAVPVKRAYILALAKVYAWASEPDLAFQQIEQFRGLPPSGYSEHNFRLDPVWDPLRSDPRFQKMVGTK